MSDLFIPGTDSLPAITFKDDGDLKICGRALPEDAVSFFIPLFEWIKAFTGEAIHLEVNLDYFNTSVSKQLLDFFKMAEKNASIKEIHVKWMYEDGDEEMLESGEIYQELLPAFHFVFHKYAELAG
jgi:hypothetical protein